MIAKIKGNATMKKLFRKLNTWTKIVQNFFNKICIRLLHPEIKRYIQFVKQNYANGKKYKIKTAYGRGWKNVVIILDKKYAFKFPFSKCDRKLTEHTAMMEKRFVDAFRKISPIYIPSIEIINWNGLTVRKYDYVFGKQITDFVPDEISEINRKKIATQLANFIWTIAQSDPVELQDLKPDSNEKPELLRGWMHTDLATNFLMDKDFNIVAVIDWEEVYWCDIRFGFSNINKSLDRRGYYGVALNTIFDYVHDYLTNVKSLDK